ncbi:hypothetical protein [Bacteroides stercorirosoris]|uniref:Uncharacterized protein n=1 Tax=Bacteroides stercorirosoris TaxID=871324 RepID=A0A1M6L5A1_9BACE|nr:hypothetical protein [Bacteroides stercorirosoris]SHJ66373.1 hypothetical protein SAMN05444350_14427 [Bacteroides stercorirosoris]
MENFKSIYKYYNDLKLDYPKLSDYELLSIAVQMQRNDILKAGLTVFETDGTPPALEAIAIQLGMKPEKEWRQTRGTILYELSEIKETLDKIADKE